MKFTYSPYILPLILAAVVSGWVVIYAWRRRNMPEATALSLMAFAITEWLLGYALEIAGADLPTKLFWGKSQYIGITLIPLAWFVFAHHHENQNKRIALWNLLLLMAIPVITVALAFTTETHGLIWKTVEIERSGSFSALSVTHGVGFWAQSAYSYILLLTGTFIIGRSLKRRQGLYRGQFFAIIVGLAAPWIGNVLYISGLSPIPHLDLTPFAFTVTVLALALGIFGYQLVNISPIARDLIVDGMSEGVIVINMQGRIADINPAAGRMIGVRISHSLGKPLAEALAPWPHLVERFRDVIEARDQIVVGEGEAQRRYEIHISPLRDRQANLLGRIITIRDTSQTALPQPRYAIQEEILSQTIPADPTSVQKSKPSIPIIEWLVNFITTPVKTDLRIPPDTNPKWHQARERSFTLILRVAALVGTFALLLAPSFAKLETGLSFAVIIALIWFLGLARNIDFQSRIIIFLLLVYVMASIETYNYGFSAASFTFFMTLIVAATLLLGRDGGLVAFLITTATLGAFGVMIGNGYYLPVSSNKGIPFPGTLQQALTNLLAFSASAAALIASIIILMESLNRAWQLETQALNLLQQERDLLDQRVTERTHDLAEARDEAVRSNNELSKYFLAIEQSGNTIVITDTQGNIEYANPRFVELTGYSLEEAAGKNPRILQSGEHRPEYYEELWSVISAGKTWHGEFHNRRKDGLLFWESATIAPLSNHLGKITNYVAIKEDVTQQKELQQQLQKQNEQMALEIAERLRAEVRLQESEERFRQIVENASDVIYRTDAQGYFTYVNPTALRTIGLKSESELLGLHYSSMASPNYRHKIKRFYDRQFLSKTPTTYNEFPVLSWDGREIWLGQNVQTICDMEKIVGFQAVARDITEIRQAQDALSLARDQALEASRLKSQILSRVSHELRTPLGSVLGYAELIKDNALGPINEEQKGAVNKIEQSANYLAGLVNDLLDEAQIETRNLSLNMGVFSPVDMLRQVKDRMSILAQNKELTLDADILPPFPNKLYGDEKRIQQILVNLTSNAIKFTKSGSIAIRIYQPVPNHWAMQVADTGVGIPQESQQDVFMPFRQLNNNVTRENRGTGLGLSIVKQIVELMNGTIELKSELNKGSAFTVILPIITPRETTS